MEEKLLDLKRSKKPYLLKIIDYKFLKEGHCCAVDNTVRILYEYTDKSLNDYIVSF